MNNTVYELRDNLYLNITNKCSCACVFCVRNGHDGVGGSGLWLDSEPSAEEVIARLRQYDVESYGEAVFCGFGEPTEALDVLLAVARYIKSRYKIPLRLNTNGLSDLANGKKTVPLLAPYIDTVSISLNASNAEDYAELCRPAFGALSFQAMLDFAVESRAHIAHTVFTIVDTLSLEEQAKCAEIADKLGIPLRVRVLI